MTTVTQAAVPPTSAGLDDVPKPRWRGRLHQVAFIVSIPLGLVLVALAGTATAKVGAAVYAFGVSALYGTSAAYHRGQWSARANRTMKRLDHSMIFVLIAATYTPLLLLVLDGAFRTVMLTAIWIAALSGLGLAMAGVAERRFVGFAMYIGLGWAALLALPALIQGLSPPELVLLVTGGVAYTAGAVGLAFRWPNPSPLVFGYHEVWHVMTVVGGLCLGGVVWTRVIVA
jgi:hemolysin III